MGIVERHKDILERLKKVAEASDGLCAAICITPNLAQIQNQASATIEALNQGLRAVGSASPEMTWDGMILGSLKFVEALLRAAQLQLEEALSDYGGAEEQEQETVH